MIKIKNIKISLLLSGLLLSSGCSLDEKFYSEVTPENFFDSQESVNQRLYRPFTHLSWFLASNADRWRIQELTSDEICITQKGSHWYDGGEYIRYHHHEWTPDETRIWNAWYGATTGAALAIDAKEDLDKLVDYDALGFPEGTKESHQMQLQILTVYFYMRALDWFGGMPIYTTTDTVIAPRNTDVETFRYIESSLKNGIPKLPVKTILGESEEGEIRQATGAMMLAQLYFNAEAYIRQDMFSECAQLCQDIIDGVYGAYDLDPTWYGPHCFTNDKSPEMIWNIPSENAKLEVGGYLYKDGMHGNSKNYFNIDASANNGFHLQPSLNPTGELYTTFKLGKPFSKFNDNDLRKKPYVYYDNESYEGMFCMGDQINPRTNGQCLGTQEYRGKLISFVDQVARFSQVGTTYPSAASLPSRITDGEENSGIRLVKYPVPNMTDRLKRANPDWPIYRLSEVYYMLAECKMRAGDKAGAAQLINKVRARNFEGADPDPVTTLNLDMYRMLDEWMLEFIGEGRRRTDLIRWNAFVTEDWWDHKASNKAYLNRFPVPTKASSSNNLLEQNTGY